MKIITNDRMRERTRDEVPDTNLHGQTDDTPHGQTDDTPHGQTDDTPHGQTDDTPQRKSSIDPSQSARVVLLVGILAGLGNVVLVPFANPSQFMLASDVYLYAADAWLAGESIYETAPPDRPGYHYLYPPITILGFLPHALLGSELASFAIQTLLNLGFGIALAAVIWRALARRTVAITTTDRVLLVGFVLLSAHSAITLLNGQVTIPLAFALAVGFDALDRQRESTAEPTGKSSSTHDGTRSSRVGLHRETLAGVAFALAALLKVFPALVGLWLLRLRAWRGVVAALVTGLGGLALGAVLLGPDLTVTYLEDVLLARYEEESFAGRPDPMDSTDGVQRQLAALGVGSPIGTVLAVAILAPAVLALYRRIDTDTRRQAALLGTLVATLLFFPLQPLYFPLLAFPLVLLLYLLPPGHPRTILVIGTLVSFLRPSYDMVAEFVVGLPVPEGVETVLLTATEALFTFVLLPTVGLWLLLVACLFVHYG